MIVCRKIMGVVFKCTIFFLLFKALNLYGIFLLNFSLILKYRTEGISSFTELLTFNQQ